ncbi:MAG: TrbC family F-type conjugative pilus assembly protein [Candidatus Competibacteraceae bacterium]
MLPWSLPILLALVALRLIYTARLRYALKRWANRLLGWIAVGLLIAAGLWLLLALVGQAQAEGLSPQDRQIIDRSQQLIQQTLQGSIPPWLQIHPAAASVSQPSPAAPGLSIRDGGVQRPAGQRPTGAQQLTVFVSRALADSELRALFEQAGGQDAVRIVFRGVLPRERIDTAVRHLHRLLRGIEPPPIVELDPVAFREAGVTAVPVLLLQDGDRVVRVSGTLALDRFRARVQAGESGDLGTWGPVEAIAETDLLEDIQRRLAGLDGAELRRRALQRFWQRARFIELPPATADRVRRLDPSIVVASDIPAPDGRYVARAGDRLNPLALLPFDRRLVIFDGSQPVQVAAARRLGAAADRPVIYVTTRIDRADGWEALQRLEGTLAQPVYLLTAEIKDRFQLERTPTVVEADGQQLVVREVRP